jgi:hypothetical protein
MNIHPVRTNRMANSSHQARVKIDSSRGVRGEFVLVDGKEFYKIANTHLMKPFFMSLVSSSNHWVFIASNGALTAGRKDSSKALFPYYSADKIVDLASSSGTRTIIQIEKNNRVLNWEPFGKTESAFETTQNIYKNCSGSKVIFEEINFSAKLLFRYSWSTSDEYGFVRESMIVNLADSSQKVSVLDGLVNVLPAGMDTDFQLRFSNLGDAYKKNELTLNQTGIFYLSSIPTDKAEPSEGLTATTVWQSGLDHAQVLICEDQIEAFKAGKSVVTENDSRGKRGCFLAVETLNLPANGRKSWMVVADVEQDHSDIVALEHFRTNNEDLPAIVQQDVLANQEEIGKIAAACDGVQVGESQLRTNRHLSNTLFNVMRGGLPGDDYRVPANDFRTHVAIMNPVVADNHKDLLDGLGETVELADLRSLIQATGDVDLIRFANEYMPLWFSRRHGDPTRPWNHFSIDVKQDDGSRKFNYEGNWRDLFQNWEALGYSFPALLPGMILRFVNASTADGYNPYRITKSGFQWEEVDPNDPWANIGYWSDHQTIYLAKLIEAARDFDPDCLDESLNLDACVFADVPYRICDYENLIKDPRSTITYDSQHAAAIHDRVCSHGSDGQLVRGSDGEIVRVTLFEKLVVSSLTKFSNLIPDAGIWMNTQRPEWNDANNALVGNGSSIVTTCYLRRFLKGLVGWIGQQERTLRISNELFAFLKSIESTLATVNVKGLTPQSRRHIVDLFQAAGETYRQTVYGAGFSGQKSEIQSAEYVGFANRCIEVLDQTIASNLRNDDLYHSYNLVRFSNDGIDIERLGLMLEGQVAALSSTALDASESIRLLEALQASPVYREDQQSYMLYPDRQLPTFLEKNCVPSASVDSSQLLQKLIADGDKSVIREDLHGRFHFAGSLRNAKDLEAVLKQKIGEPDYSSLVDNEIDSLKELFESTFEHRRFAGRSSTFFAYEGLGSIYWHMVSKLVLAIQENYLQAVADSNFEAAETLKAEYEAARDGLGLTKTPDHYGAFPTDPYSHTPSHAGVQQPGMTGQVKEDFISRLVEIGVRVNQGQLSFETSLFDRSELLTESAALNWVNSFGVKETLSLQPGQFGFTFCRVPVVYQVGELAMTVCYQDGTQKTFAGNQLSIEDSASMFERKNQICRIDVSIDN